MLTQLYLLYKKSPKKCRELDESVDSLRMYLSNEDRYGAYLTHLELTEKS